MRGETAERVVDAYGLAVRRGHWYLVGLDLTRGELRSFRLSRLESDLADEGEGSEPPDGFRAADVVGAVAGGPDDVGTVATVALSPDVAWWAIRGVADAEVLRTREDGWAMVRLPQQQPESLAGWVLSFGPDAEAIEPPELRGEVVRRLEAAGAAG
jgi:proteasome accessory factor B